MKKPLGHRWRSSNVFILSCIALALFSENFIYSFIVPILPIILEDHLHLDKTKTQINTSAVLSIHALACFVSGPIIGSWADKFPSRKVPLLLSLSGEIVGTIIVAAATSLPVLFVGRIVQAIAGNAAWIVGFATVADIVGADNRARSISTISVFFMSGLLIGPMVSGTLIKLVGYWPTWLVAIAILVIDMMLRLIMLESPVRPTGDIGQSRSDLRPSDETSTLIPRGSTSHVSQNNDIEQSLDPASRISATTAESSTLNFYKFLLSNPRVLTALACHANNALTLVSFDTTLPLHVTQAFGWDTVRVGLMFLLLQLPTLFLSPLTGWMKDRVGTKLPTVVGLLATALLLWALGTPGPDGLLFVGSGKKGQVVYMSSMLGLGVVRSLLAGCGLIEMTSVVTELQETRPDIFGLNGGFSRAYALTNMSWTLSMFVGPILTGFLMQTAGYYYMNLCLAFICFVCAIFALIYFQKK